MNPAAYSPRITSQDARPNRSSLFREASCGYLHRSLETIPAPIHLANMRLGSLKTKTRLNGAIRLRRTVPLVLSRKPKDVATKLVPEQYTGAVFTMQMPSSPARHFEYAALAEFSYLFFEKVDHYLTFRFPAPARQFVDTVRGSPRQGEGEPLVSFSHDLALPGSQHEHSKSVLKGKTRRPGM